MSYRLHQQVAQMAAEGLLDVSANEMSVLSCVAWFANEEKNLEAWPGYERMQSMTRLSASTIYRALTGLKERKFVDLTGTKNRFRCRLMDPASWSQSVTQTDPVRHSDRPSTSHRPTQSVTLTDELSTTSGTNEVENSVPSGDAQGEEDQMSLAMAKPKRLNASTLADYLCEAVPREMAKYGHNNRGNLAGGRGAVAKSIKKLLDVNPNNGEVRGLTYEEILERMDTYATTPWLWNTQRHCAWDFLDAATQGRLGNIQGSSGVAKDDHHGDEVDMTTLAARLLFGKGTDSAAG